MKNLKKILFLLTPSERRHTGFLLFMILIMALLDMIGVASIMPFMAVLANPNVIETSSILNFFYKASNIFGVENNKQFLFALGILVFILLVISLIFKAITNYALIRFCQMRLYSLSRRLVECYLNQPYSWFLNHNSADLGKTILSEVSEVIGGGLAPLLDLIAKSTISVCLLTLLIVADPQLALIVGGLLGSAYGSFFYFIRKYLNKIGEQRLTSNQLRFTMISEAFGAAKEVKAFGLEQSYVGRFSDPAKKFAKNTASSKILSLLPRFFFEGIAFGGILLMILYLMKNSDGFESVLPVLSLYVFAGYRLMPAIQQIFASATQIVFRAPSIDKLYNDVKNLRNLNNQINEHSKLLINKKITLKNIFYNYPNSSRTALENINLNITSNTIVGIVGPTGSGKSTLIDIILGLLEPKKGILEVDDEIITKKNVRDWQKSIGYVPQHIYLSDDTIAANIAFGINTKKINQELVERVSKIANLHNFVSTELSQKYQTTIGERGVRLSGGQRQRIGIARALYRDPQILILDEATSALDNITEKSVMDAVDNLSKKITIIMVAHRLNTVKKCDKIFLLENGKLKNQGTFDELIKVDDNFRVTANN
jgi:ABC-type multidrug transport system fused ATPase/permease subunit